MLTTLFLLTCLSGNIISGLIASFVFLIFSYFFYYIKWVIFSSKFIGIWEQYEFNEGKDIYSICNKNEVRGTSIQRCFLNPQKIKVFTITYENYEYRYWKAQCEFISSNYCTGEFQYLPDNFKYQWGKHELRTLKNNKETYILLTVQDAGSRGFDRSGQLLKKVSKNDEKYNMIKTRIESKSK